jgi:uncharacterized cupin superfamily protein
MSEKLVVRIDPEKLELQPTQFVSADLVLDGTPNELAADIFSGSNGSLQLGVWECTPYSEAANPYGIDEFCLLLKGRVSFTDDAGNKDTFSAGESYLVRKDFSGIFRVEEPTRKLYAIFESIE